jgi:hypothetical protein
MGWERRGGNETLANFLSIIEMDESARGFWPSSKKS